LKRITGELNIPKKEFIKRKIITLTTNEEFSPQASLRLDYKDIVKASVTIQCNCLMKSIPLVLLALVDDSMEKIIEGGH